MTGMLLNRAMAVDCSTGPANAKSCNIFSFSFFLAQQPLSVKACLYHLWGLAFSDLWITPHSRIVNPRSIWGLNP